MKLIALVLGIIGNILSVLVLASPMATFWTIFKRGSTESFSAFPYVCTLLSNMLWLYYGILNSKGILLVTIGAAGCTFEAFYLSVYMAYAAKQERLILIKQMLVILLIYLAVMVFTMRFTYGDVRLRVVGILCALNSVCMYASPLGIVRLVIATKSVEYMPFLLSLSLFLCGGVWFGYAILMKDLYLEISNGSGCLLGFVQLMLYALYCNYEFKDSSIKEDHLSNGHINKIMKLQAGESNITNDQQDSSLHGHLINLLINNRMVPQPCHNNNNGH